MPRATAASTEAIRRMASFGRPAKLRARTSFMTEWWKLPNANGVSVPNTSFTPGPMQLGA
jgi:hypothetical protein